MIRKLEFEDRNQFPRKKNNHAFDRCNSITYVDTGIPTKEETVKTTQNF